MTMNNLGAHYYRHTEQPNGSGVAMNYGSGIGDIPSSMIQHVGSLSAVPGFELGKQRQQPQQSEMGQAHQIIASHGLAGSLPPNILFMLGLKLASRPNIINEMNADLSDIAKASSEGDAAGLQRFTAKYGEDIMKAYMISQIKDPEQQKQAAQDFDRTWDKGLSPKKSNTGMYVAVGGVAVVGAIGLYMMMNKKKSSEEQA